MVDHRIAGPASGPADEIGIGTAAAHWISHCCSLPGSQPGSVTWNVTEILEVWAELEAASVTTQTQVDEKVPNPTDKGMCQVVELEVGECAPMLGWPLVRCQA